MNIHKRLDRFAQWSKEKTGAKKNTGEDEEFKALQQEMNQRHEGEFFGNLFALSMPSSRPNERQACRSFTDP